MPDAAAPVRTTHVVLVGLMGSGKTTVGKKVAKLIGHRFVDADVELEARTGRSVASWFDDGEAAFRQLASSLFAGSLLGGVILATLFLVIVPFAAPIVGSSRALKPRRSPAGRSAARRCRSRSWWRCRCRAPGWQKKPKLPGKAISSN